MGHITISAALLWVVARHDWNMSTPGSPNHSGCTHSCIHTFFLERSDPWLHFSSWLWLLKLSYPLLPWTQRHLDASPQLPDLQYSPTWNTLLRDSNSSKTSGSLAFVNMFCFFLNFSGSLIFKFLSGSSLLATLRQGLAFSGSTKKWSHW